MLSTITISPSPATVAASGTLQFTAGYNDARGDTMDMTGIAAGTWNSTSPGVATISASGLATWVGAGTTHITHSRGGVTSDVAVLRAEAAVAAEGFAPDFSWHPIVDGYYPNTRVNAAAAMQVNVESFGGSPLAATEYDAGDGTYHILTHTRPTGLLSGSYGTTNNGWSNFFRAAAFELTAGPARAPGQQWDRLTRTGDPNDDWEITSRLLVGHNQIRGSADEPLRLRCKCWVRGTPGKVLRYGVAINGGAQLVPITTLPALTAGVEQAIDVEFEWPTPLIEGGSIDLRFGWYANGPWAQGEYFEVANCGFFRAQLFDEPDKYIYPVAMASGSGDALGLGNNLTGPQNNLPIHRHRGLQIFGSGGATWDEAITDLTNVGGAHWSGTNWTMGVSAVPGMLNDLIGAGHPGRFWFDAAVADGGRFARVGRFALAHMAGATITDAEDEPENGTVAGRVVWVHMTARNTGGAFPLDGDLEFHLTGAATYTGLGRVIRDTPTADTYHLLFRILVASNNVATAFTGALENVSGRALAFQIGAIWIEREVWNPTNPRNVGGPDQWMPPRAHYGPGVIGTTADTMKRARIDLSQAFDVWNHTAIFRYWFGFDPEDLRGRPSGQIKWCDSGPNAHSALTYLYELITQRDGSMTFRINISNSGGGLEPGMKTHEISWLVTPGLFRPYDFNDVSVTVTKDEGITQVYVNGTWLDLTTPGVIEIYRVLPTVPVVSSGGALAGATSIPVKALRGAIPSGATLYFKPGNVQALTTGAVSAGATAIPVAALSGTIRSGETASYATAWALNQYTPIWLGMDRDLDCAIKSWLTAFEFVNTPQSRAAIEQRCLYLNSLGDVGEVIP